MVVTHERAGSPSGSTVANDRIHLPAPISEHFGTSRSEARRLIVQGGVKVDGATPLSFDYEPEQLAGKTLTVGKKRSVKL